MTKPRERRNHSFSYDAAEGESTCDYCGVPASLWNERPDDPELQCVYVPRKT